MVINLSDQTFETEVLQDKKPCLVAFTSARCSSCKTIEPILSVLSDKYLTIKIAKIDVSKYPKFATKYSLGSLPTLLFFSRGLINQYVGKPTAEAIGKFFAIHG